MTVYIYICIYMYIYLYIQVGGQNLSYPSPPQNPMRSHVSKPTGSVPLPYPLLLYVTSLDRYIIAECNHLKMFVITHIAFML